MPLSPNPSPSSAPPRSPWIGRIALAIGAPLALLCVLEAGLRLAGYGRPASFLVADEKPGYLRTNPDFASLFLPGNFDLRPLNFRVAAHKPPNTFRIVVLGESAAQGVPVPSFAFAPQLRAQLRSRYPGREFEVLDTGIVAINSHVIYQIARDMARVEPDLFLVYAGNNEVVGPYGPGCAYLSQMPPLWVIRASVFVRSTRTGQFFSSLIARVASRTSHPAEWGGMSMFVDSAVAGDDPRLGAVYANFAANLRGIVAAASAAGAKTVLCTVVANLKDCPPLLSRHEAGLNEKQLASWKAAYDDGRMAWLLGDDAEARAALEGSVRIDPQYADAHFMLGSIDFRSGNTAAARRHFADSLHWDALRFRPDPAINAAIRDVAGKAGPDVSLLDLASALGSEPASQAPISGRELLFEHVHFDWPGNYRVARMMARSCAASLFGGDPGDTGWLDNDACAAALAFTAHERPPMLLRIDVLIRKPPFTNQLIHIEDEAAMAREIAEATQAAREPATLAAASAIATQALSHDPDNPALAGVLEGVDLDTGDLEGALALARRAAALLPADFATSADEASILIRLGRFDEAGTILTRAAASGADLDMLAPVLSDLWIRTRKFDEGLRFLEAAIAKNPRDRRLRLVHAGLMRASGDGAVAEREFRAVLAEDPSNEDALESLVGLLVEGGRQGDAAHESLANAAFQPRNQENSLRAAKAAQAGGDGEGVVTHLLAAERSGPVNATFELTLALDLYRLRRMDEMMEHLEEARRLSLGEGNRAVTDSIEKLERRMRSEIGRPHALRFRTWASQRG